MLFTTSRLIGGRARGASVVFFGLAATVCALLTVPAARGQAPPAPSASRRDRSSAQAKNAVASTSNTNDIRRLSQHFIEPGGDLSPWMFLPQENIKDISTAEHPGMLTIWPGERGRDIKGILKDPIRITDYPLPWEFHLGMVQNFIAWKGLSEKQINYATGLNLAVTFSDPSTWPKDRSQLPPDTHSMQLLVVHLGNIGENYRQGVPQLKQTPLNMFDPSPEVYMVYGRGDLSPEARGNWNLAYPWVGPVAAPSGSWSKHAGPADFVIRFRVQVMSPRALLVGVGYGNHPGWKYRVIDVSRFGPITGIWEIGPIYSLDNWIPKVLAKELHLDEPPAWLEGLKLRNTLLAKPAPENKALTEAGKLLMTIEPPDPSFQYFLDYAVFYGNGPMNLEHLSEDFNIPGFLADQKYFIEGNAFCETHSNPGYLTATLYGINGSWAMCPIVDVYGGIDFARRKPPFEIELAYKSPDDRQPWNLWWNVGVYDEKGTMHTWQPGVQNVPGQGCRFFNVWTNDPNKIERNPLIELEFDPPLPQSVLAHKPLYMLIQVPDQMHLRVGFKAAKDAPWIFSRPFDSTRAFGKIAKFAYPALVSFQGGWNGKKGWGAGNYPAYQKFLIDYLYYRYGASH